MFEKIKGYLNSSSLNGQTIRYGLAGGTNVLLGWVLYFITYNFILHKQNVVIGSFLTISPHIFALLSTFCVQFITGFFLNFYFVFQLRTKLYPYIFKYFLSNMGSLVINYVLLKLFVEVFHWYPTPSQVLTTCIVTVYSFLAQKFFSFKTKKNNISTPTLL